MSADIDLIGVLSLRDRAHHAQMYEVAKAVVEDPDKNQKQVAEQLELNEVQVSRLIREARRRGMIRTTVIPPRYLGLEDSLIRKLGRYGVRDVVVGPHGSGKNEAAVGAIAAQLLLAAINRVAEKQRTIRITFSCGATLRSAIEQFHAVLAANPEALRFTKAVTLEVYPSTLYPGHRVDSIYPATLVTMFKISMPRTVGHRLSTHAYTMSLPDDFKTHRTVPDHVRAFVDDAAKADIFLLGIGRSDDRDYRRLTSELQFPSSETLPARYPLEIVYTPIDPGGRPLPGTEQRIVGVGLAALQEARNDPRRHVIGTIGGESKQTLLVPAAKTGCFTEIASDEVVAEHADRTFGTLADER